MLNSGLSVCMHHTAHGAAAAGRNIRDRGTPGSGGSHRRSVRTGNEVTINPKRRAADDFVASWRRICPELRGRRDLRKVTEDDIRDEIDRFRAG